MGEEPNHYLEMARALYGFRATVGKTLSFREHEMFLIYHPSTKEKNWWQVINAKAQVGYVPSNYVTAVQVSPEFISEFLENTMALVRAEGPDLPTDRSELLARLQHKRRRVDGGSGDEKGLSRTPSIISIPPAPTKANPPQTLEVQCVPEPAPAVPSPVDERKKPPTAEKTVSVKRRVAELCGQIEGNTGTLKRASSKTRATVEPTPKPPAEPKKELKSSGRAKSVERPTDPLPEPDVRQPEKDTEPDRILERLSTRRSSRQETRGITEETVYQLVEQVRCHTDLSHEKSRVAVGVILSAMEKYIPEHPVLTTILNHLQGPMRAPKPLLEQTHDAQRLHLIFNELTSCKDDAQQRSWMLHEDEDVIIDYIKELTSILTNADASVSLHVVASDQYSGVVALAQLYQMEVRWSIRQPLLTSLGVLCGLDRQVINILLSSVLPSELARDMTDNPDTVKRLNYEGLLLTMIFCMGDPMPITHFEHLGIDFLKFIFNLIEDPPARDVEEQIPDLFVTLLLSYNLQFRDVDENVLIRALAKRPVAKTFTEKILILLNREDDPVRMFDHEPAPPNSVLKMFVDVFSNSTTAGLFYTNDVKVLIDIIVRQLTDLSPGDSRRHQYLCLCRVVMRNPGYSEHHHRRDDILKCFTRIFCEETDISRDDQRLVREISNEFPQYFKA